MHHVYLETESSLKFVEQCNFQENKFDIRQRTLFIIYLPESLITALYAYDGNT